MSSAPKFSLFTPKKKVTVVAKRQPVMVPSQRTGSEKKPMTLAEGERNAEEFTRDAMRTPFFEKIEVAGSIRRRKAIVNDIDMVAIPRDPAFRKQVAERARHDESAERSPEEEKLERRFEEAIAKIPDAHIKSFGGLDATIIYKGTQINMFLTTPKFYGATLLYATGPNKSDIGMRQKAKGRSLKLNNYGLWRGNELLASKTEKDVRDALGLKYKSPEMRK